jgi:hypothetical protein
MKMCNTAAYHQEVFMEELHATNGELADGRSLSLYRASKHGAKKIEIEEGFSRMGPAEHLDAAKRALADGYKLDENPTKTVWGRVGDAKKHLQEIMPDCPQYKEARSLLHKTLVRERQIDHICLSIANQVMVKQREMIARELEQLYVTKGLFIDIELSGPDKTFMKLACPLFRETSIDRIADESGFFGHLEKAGFSKLLISDDEENVWTYKLGMLR